MSFESSRTGIYIHPPLIPGVIETPGSRPIHVLVFGLARIVFVPQDAREMLMTQAAFVPDLASEIPLIRRLEISILVETQYGVDGPHGVPVVGERRNVSLRQMLKRILEELLSAAYNG